MTKPPTTYANRGWDIGGPYSADSNTSYWGGNTGVVIYADKQNKDANAQLDGMHKDAQLQKFDENADRYSKWRQSQPPTNQKSSSGSSDGNNDNWCKPVCSGSGSSSILGIIVEDGLPAFI